MDEYELPVLLPYSPTDYEPDDDERLRNRWANHLSLEELKAMVHAAGFDSRIQRRFRDKQIISA